VALDHTRAGVRVAVEQAVHRLGIEPLAQLGGAGDVRDDDAHQPAGRLGRDRGRGGRRLGDGGGEGGILREDRPFELAQPVARLDAQLLDELPAGVLVDLQRVGLPVAAVQREHELRAQALAVRVGGDQRLQLADDLRVPAELELRLDELLERGHAQVVQARDLALREGLVGEVVERAAAPEGERL
jgi:hypothetical protein